MDLRAQLLIMETDTKTKPKTKNVLVYMMTQKPRLKIYESSWRDRD